MKRGEQVTLVLADDHPMFRAGLRDTIVRDLRYEVLGEASDGGEAYELIASLTPRVAILDVEMPRMSGLDVAERICTERLPVSVIILTMYEEYALFNRAVNAGVRGYILKESAVRDIVQGIAKVVEGGYYFSASLSGYLMKKGGGEEARTASGGPESLTPMERQVLKLIARSLSSREIAEHLSVSVKTVESHRHNICQKLHLSGSYSLLRYALVNTQNL